MALQSLNIEYRLRLSIKIMERYQRQIIISQFGLEGQEKLASAKVLVVGAGGLGCPVLMYLAAAGIGQLGIVDQDVVSLSNLHRQILYKTEDIGLPKVQRAAFYLNQMNPEVNITTYLSMLSTENALAIIDNYDIVVDATDNFPSRYMINDACVILGKPLIYGAVSNFEGQVAVFNADLGDDKRSSNYRDIFPNPPMENEIDNCAEIGVLGVLPGTIGCIQASEVIKLITGIGKPLTNQLQTVNLLTNHWQTFNIKSSGGHLKKIPSDKLAFKNHDYNLLCDADTTLTLKTTDFHHYWDRDDVAIVDVRELSEIPEINSFNHLKYPLSTWERSVPVFEQSTIVLFCQSGKRSLEAAKILTTKYAMKTILSLEKGILNWQNNFNNHQI
jgi:sulfur-carrier protein adenylyltransferase/sulfurtransferase